MAQNKENEFEKSQENILNDEFDSENTSTENNDSATSEKNKTTDNKVNLTKDVAQDYEEDTEESEKYVSQFGELEDFVEGYQSDDFNGGNVESVMPPKKKMSKKKLATIIVVIAVVVVALAIGVYFVFFNNNIKGTTWLYTDENSTSKTYYTFTGKTMEIVSGDEYMTQKNIYCDVKYDGNTISVMNGENVGVQYTYTISGNLIQGKTLTLSMEGYVVAEMPNANKIELPEELSGPEFTKNDDIIGIWKNTAEQGYVDYMTFTEDGMMTQFMGNNTSIQEVSQKYNFDGEAINLKYQDTDYPITARVEGDKLIVTSSQFDSSTYTYQEVEIIYEKTTQEDLDKTEKSLLAGTCEIPTSATTATTATSSATEATTEATSEQKEATEESTELVTEAVTTAE